MSDKNNKTREIVRILEKTYGIPERDGFKEPLDELIFTILSQNTNDRNRDRAWMELKRSFPNYESILNSSQKKLEKTIRVAGLAEQKSKNIIQILKKNKKRKWKTIIKFSERLQQKGGTGISVITKGRGTEDRSLRASLFSQYTRLSG